MTIVCTTPELGGTIEEVDLENDYCFIREVIIPHNGVDWVCPLIFPKTAWQITSYLLIEK